MRATALVAIAVTASVSVGSCAREPEIRHFATPEEAVGAFTRTLRAAVTCTEGSCGKMLGTAYSVLNTSTTRMTTYFQRA